MPVLICISSILWTAISVDVSLFQEQERSVSSLDGSETGTVWARSTHALHSERLRDGVCVCVCVEHEVSRKKPRLMLAESNGHADSAEITSHKHQDKAYYLDASKEGNVARFINVRHQLLITTEKNFFIMRFKNTNYEMKSWNSLCNHF